MKKGKNYMTVPINTKITAWLVKKLIHLFEFKTVAIYADDNTPFKFVIMEGNPMSAILGISSMINTIALETGKSEQEVINMIMKSCPQKI